MDIGAMDEVEAKGHLAHVRMLAIEVKKALDEAGGSVTCGHGDYGHWETIERTQVDEALERLFSYVGVKSSG